jgi:hypothetical protein
MRLITLGEGYSWKKFKGKSVVYLLRWDTKNYVGATDHIEERLRKWNRVLKPSLVKAKILLICPKELRNFYEERAIEVYKSLEYGHNELRWARGSVLGRKVTDLTKNKMSKARLGKPLSKETREKLRKINTGKKLSKEHVEKISKALTGKKFSEKRRQALREAWKIRRKRDYPNSKGPKDD